MNAQPVLTKQDFVRRYARGEFGNASPTWHTLEDWVSAHPKMPDGLFHIRNRVAGGVTYYNLDAKNLIRTWTSINAGSNFYISAMAPTDQTLIQGEVQQSTRHLSLTYTCERLPMREALAVKSYHLTGAMAVACLKLYLCPNSYDWMQHLLDSYTDHVVEFSTYAVNWGTLPNYNTVFWEVRKY